MKKIVLAVAALGLISLTSCKKEYTCECSGNGVFMSSTKIKETKKKAKDACTDLGVTTASGSISCVIK